MFKGYDEKMFYKKIMVREGDNEWDSVKYKRLGEEKYNTYGSLMRIVDYRKAHDIDVVIVTQQVSGEVNYYLCKYTDYDHFNRTMIGSPYDRTRCGVGYMGEGQYDSVNSEKAHGHWAGMLRRCTDIKLKERSPTYNNVSCHTWFHNFQNFAYWYYNNYYEFEGETMCLDKDILIKGNKMYGPDECVFVPNYINTLFTTRPKRENLPKGLDIVGNNYKASIVNKGVETDLGTYSDINEAFNAYAIAKKEQIKRVANYYWFEKGGQFISQFKKVYDAMMNYKVEITD